ncbi:tyrosine-type recombinase/integrase [Bacteroides fragilis]|uniref:tyrosine-type recombinase/integrase n=1 Tax=Bacteroides fragilis TaxID=817 RepID=UPI0022E52C46|nr:tyrosine-type recombinase/integrase [Bacteroides fragilis]MCI7229389.1 tyrosine-type recombinase/integrase [Bacteroides fragilis]
MPLFPKQAANSLVTETLQYFVFFCRSVYYAIFAKCLIINDLRLILVILFFIAFLNFTYLARHTFATEICLTQGVPIESVSKMLGHTNIQTTQIYARVVDRKLSHDMEMLEQKLQNKGKRAIAIVNP